MARLSSFVRGASGVEQHKAILILQEGDVGVAEDDDAGVREATPQAPAASLLAPGVVDHGHPDATKLEPQALREIQVRGIQVAAHNLDRKSTRLNSSHANISYAVFCLKK